MQKIECQARGTKFLEIKDRGSSHGEKERNKNRNSSQLNPGEFN